MRSRGEKVDSNHYIALGLFSSEVDFNIYTKQDLARRFLSRYGGL